MPTLGEFLAGTAEGLTRAVGTAGQAVGTAQRIQSMLGTAEEMRRQRELFPYQLESAKAEAGLKGLQYQQAERLQNIIQQPIPLSEPTAQPSAEPAPPQTIEQQRQTAVNQAIQQSTIEQFKKPIDVKQIEVSNVVPKTTIQTIMQDPVLSRIAVAYDASGRPYTTIERLQMLDKVLSSTSAVENRITEKVVQATIQGLNEEKDKLYDELEKLTQNPEKNADKIKQIQNKIALISQRINSAIQYGLATDLKLLADYYYREGKLTNEQEKIKNALETKMMQLNLTKEIADLKNKAALSRLELEQKKIEEQANKLLKQKEVAFILNNGDVVYGTIQYTPAGKKVYTDIANNIINPDSVDSIFPNTDTVNIQARSQMLKKSQPKKEKKEQTKLRKLNENLYIYE